MAVLRRRHRKPSPEGVAFRAIFEQFSDTDRPVGFGPGQRWMAVPTDRSKLVAELLDAAVAPSRWATGVALAGDDGRIFVTPPVDRWVLVVGHEATADDLAALSNRLGEAQSFVADADGRALAWERWVAGNVVRRGQVRSIDGAVSNVREFGAMTDGERQAGVSDDLRGSVSELDERLVLAVADAWSVDPSSLDGRTQPEGPGWLGRIIRYPVGSVYA